LNSSYGIDDHAGYQDYTNLSVDLVQGQTYDITLSAEIEAPWGTYEVWRVWIDYNQDNDFLDPGEKEVGYKSQQIGWETHSFTVPSTAATGATRMRVALKRSSAPTPCEIFPYGQVEDYTVNILPAKQSSEALDLLEKEIASVVATPNPATTYSNIQFEGFSGMVNVVVFDVTGEIIYSNYRGESKLIQLDLNDWKSGLYFVRVTDVSGRTATTKLIRQ
jgi:hypothetical protein